MGLLPTFQPCSCIQTNLFRKNQIRSCLRYISSFHFSFLLKLKQGNEDLNILKQNASSPGTFQLIAIQYKQKFKNKWKYGKKHQKEKKHVRALVRNVLDYLAGKNVDMFLKELMKSEGLQVII